MSDQGPELDQPSAVPPAPALEPTGEPALDEALRMLDSLDESPVDEHVAVFEQLHATLRETLSRPVDAPQQAQGSAPALP